MYRKTLAIWVCIIFFTADALAQPEKIIHGTIHDEQSEAYIQGALVVSVNLHTNAISNGEGAFVLTVSGGIVTDSLVIDALGYERKVIPLTTADAPIRIKLRPVTYALPDVTVAGYRTNWATFMANFAMALKAAVSPFESDVQKTIDVSINNVSQRKINLKAFAHYEGLTMAGLKSYLRGLTFWYTVTDAQFGDTTAFTDSYEGNPQVFTDFERGRFQWLITTDTTGMSSGESIARYHMEAITEFGGDSVFVVKHTPKPEDENKNVHKLNQFSSNGVYTFFSGEKTYYIRKKDYRILRIDFYQTSGQLNSLTAKNVKNIDHISATVGFQHPANSPHPAYIYETIVYNDMQGNLVERRDSAYYSNVKKISLSDNELKTKYQLNKIYRSYPIRSVDLHLETRLGAFWYVPMIKK